MSSKIMVVIVLFFLLFVSLVAYKWIKRRRAWLVDRTSWPELLTLFVRSALGQ